MPKTPTDQLERLLSVMERLRHPQTGCDWDREQTFATIAPYTLEEAYEVADAIERGDIAALKGELGDLLLQVVFHARIAEEAGYFDFSDIAAAISDKLETRHPHLFGGEMLEAANQAERWEALKALERKAGGATSALDGVALALPALMRAEKLQKRAAQIGFDWPDTDGPKAKILEELDEFEQARDDDARLTEAGDLLFSAVNLLRRHGIAPEDAMRRANRKFERRFREMERLAACDGVDFAALSLEEKDTYWRAVKASESAESS